MKPSSRTPEGLPNRCPICHAEVCIEPSMPPGDAPCPSCGHLLWFGRGTGLETLEFVDPDAIIRDLGVDSKTAAIELLVNRLVEVGRLPATDSQAVKAAILRREELGSTGFGNGVAVPHTKYLGVQKLIAAVGYADAGIDFDALDGGKVHTIFLLVSPPLRPGDHLRALERICQLARR